MNRIGVVIAGAGGRMGRTLLEAIAQSEDFTVVGALENHGHPDLGSDVAPGIKLTDDPLPAIAKAQALIDFTRPAVSVELAALAAQARIVHVIGTTGLSADDEKKIEAASRHAVIVKSGNMSLGVNLLAALVKQAAKRLPDYDVEIVEMHHRLKVDAPSGTALLLGKAAADGRDVSLDKKSVRSRDGHTGARETGSIGFAALRGGTVVGEHQVILAGPHERVVLSHVAEDRSIFANGALVAARWGQGKKPGLYSMADVLGHLSAEFARRMKRAFQNIGEGEPLIRPQKRADLHAAPMACEREAAAGLRLVLNAHPHPIGIEFDFGCVALHRMTRNRKARRRERDMLVAARGAHACIERPAEQRHIRAHERRNRPCAAQQEIECEGYVHRQHHSENDFQGARAHVRAWPEHGIEQNGSVAGHDGRMEFTGRARKMARRR